MGTPNICFALTLLFVATVVGAASAAEPKADGLLSDKAEERREASEQVLKSLKQTEDRLLAIVSDRKKLQDKHRKSVVLAIQLLGKMRSRRAVPLLLEMVEFEVEVEIPEGRRIIPWTTQYPSVQALVDIGLWRPIVEKIARTDATMRSRLYSYCLLKILTFKHALGILEDAVAKQKDKVKRQNLENAVYHIQGKGIPKRTKDAAPKND